jgi:hypothetical protein
MYFNNPPPPLVQRVLAPSRPTGTTMRRPVSLESLLGKKTPDLVARCMQILDAVQYLSTVSRTDIANATGKLARFVANPTRYFLMCAKGVLRYLFTTVNFGLVLNGGTAIELKWNKMLATNDEGIDATNTVLYGDKTSCISVCKDPQSADRTRHNDGQYKKIQELVKNNVISVKWIPTKSMLADCLPKQFCGSDFAKARFELEVLDLEKD